jgi:hypothetical protein
VLRSGRWLQTGALLVLAALAAPALQAQTPYLIKDRDRDKNQGYQSLRHMYMEWFQEWVEDQIRANVANIPAQYLRMDDVIWTDLDGNPVTVNEAITLILGQDDPLVAGISGDLVVDGAMLGDWRDVPVLLEEEAQGRLERANATLIAYKNSFQALGQHYLASRERYDSNMSLHVQAINDGLAHEGRLEHLSSTMAVFDAESVRDLRRLIAIISYIDGADAARELANEGVRLDRRMDEAEGMADRVTATPVPLPPARWR